MSYPVELYHFSLCESKTRSEEAEYLFDALGDSDIDFPCKIIEAGFGKSLGSGSCPVLEFNKEDIELRK